MKESIRKLPEDKIKQMSSEEEGCIHILRGLISYHERMTMGRYPERDMYLDALRLALKCVEERAEKKNGAEN